MKCRSLAFTLIELLVVIAVIAVLMGILMPALSRAREQGKRAVCLAHVKQLGLSWVLYADENDEKIVNACTVANTEGHNDSKEPCWLYFRPNDQYDTEQERIDGIKQGALWSFIEQLNIYKCPTGIRGEVNTYGIMDAMNGAANSLKAQSGVPNHLFVKTRTKIKRPGERLVFVDEGKTSAQSFTIHYNKASWWDMIPVRHGKGTNFSFADGHAEYWKWSDERTLKFGRQEDDWASYRVSPDNLDLERVQRGAWGELGY